MLEGLLHHKKEEKDHLCALVVSEDQIDVALWETTASGKATILKTASEKYSGEWEEAINAADKAITAIEDALPEGKDLTQIVFGLYPEWLSEDHAKIHDDYLKKLKQLTSSLSLKPRGFVELPTAVSHLLQKDEGTQQTVILIGIESKHVTVSLFKIGKLIGSTSVERTEQITADVEKALGTFTTIEVLPSRLLIYGAAASEAIKGELLNYPWQKKANFLHIPKIELLAPDFPVKAVAVASNTELTPHPEEGAESEVAEPPAAEKSEETGDEEVDTSAEVTAVAEDLGFVQDKDVQEQPTVEAPDEADISEEESNVVVPPPPTHAVPTPHQPPRDIKINESPISRKSPALLSLFSSLTKRLPRLELTLNIPRLKKMPVMLVSAGLVVILLIMAVLGYWVLPKATVTILVSPETLNKSQQLTVSVDATSVDTEAGILPGSEVKTEIASNQKIQTSDTKTVGERAKGEVTIYNKTLNNKTFKKGTILSSGSLDFTLDEETTVEAATESVGSLTYGSTKARITADKIGTASNLPSNSDFTFEGLPSSSYSARNDSTLAGGTSRDVKVVSRDDYAALRTQAQEELEKQAADELKGKIESGQRLIESSITSKITSETFDKEIGEEADEVSVDMVLTVSGLIYQEEDLLGLIDAMVTSNVPENYEYNRDAVTTKMDEVSKDDDAERLFLVHMDAQLLPKIETGDLAQKLAGRSLSEATEYLRSQRDVAGVEFDVQRPLSWMKDILPANAKNIEIQISPLNK